VLPDGADSIGFSKVSLVWGHILNAAMTMLAVVPLHKAFNPEAHGIQVAKPSHRVALMVFHRFKQ
jgi:hypothetical protein